MSMPSFPEINPELTREKALEMILASIAMEELALSHIMNAEGEKLQHILSMKETCDKKRPSIDEILCVNQSISNLLDIVSQNQFMLKNKMERVLQSLPCKCSDCNGPNGPQRPPKSHCKSYSSGSTCCCFLSKCSAIFKCTNKCEIWHVGCTLPWNKGNIQGQCIRRDPCNNSKIQICSKGRYMISFIANVSTQLSGQCDIAISIQMHTSQHCLDVFTYKDHILCSDTTITISIGGIIVDACGNNGTPSLCLYLESPDSLTVENSMFTIVEI